MRMKCNKVLSALLAILMVLGSFASLAYAVFADETDASTDTAQGSETTGDPDNSDTDTGDGTDSDDSGDTPKVDYLNRKFASAEEKIASMELKLERYGYQLYYDSYTGEVAYVNTVTGQSMFTNPIDIPTSTSAKKTKQHLLSQLVVNYTEDLLQLCGGCRARTDQDEVHQERYPRRVYYRSGGDPFPGAASDQR